jgi:hypothetical protein
MPMMQVPPAVRKEFEIRAPSAPQLELRLHWFGRALEARCGYIVRVERGQRGLEHVASIAYEMPLPRYGRRSRVPARADGAQSLLGASGADATARAGVSSVSRL